MGKKIFICILLTSCLLMIFGMFNLFVFNHTLKAELIEEISINDTQISMNSYPNCFFIKDSYYNNFYDGEKILKEVVSNYDISTLDTKRYTYVVSMNSQIDSISYSGQKCNKRKCMIFPYEYKAETKLKYLNDGKIRIYRLKKINVDYDYHK